MMVTHLGRSLVCATALMFAWHAIPATAQDEQNAAETELDPKGVAAWERLVGVMGTIPAPPGTSNQGYPPKGTRFRMGYVDYATLNDLTPGGYVERTDPDKFERDPETGEITNYTLVTRNVTSLFSQASVERTSVDSIGISSKRFAAGTNASFGWGLGREAIILFSETGLADATSQIEKTFQSNGLGSRAIGERMFWYNYEDDQPDLSNEPIGPTFNNLFSWLGGRGPTRITIAPNALMSVRTWESAEEVAKALSGQAMTVAELHSPLAALDLLRDLMGQGYRLVQMRYGGEFDAAGAIQNGYLDADLQYEDTKLVMRGTFFESESEARRMISEENDDLTAEELENFIKSHIFEGYGKGENVIAFIFYEDDGIKDPWHMNQLYAEFVKPPSR